MLKKIKFVNVICIILVLSVLALALAVGLFGLSALRNDTPIDMLGDFEDATEPPPPIIPPSHYPYKVRSDVDMKSVYLRAQSYGDYDGKEWGMASPYTKLVGGKYPATYLASKAIEYRELSYPIALEIIPNNAIEVVPSYTATDTSSMLSSISYTEEYNIPANDVNANPIRNDYYRMYYYNYQDITNQPGVMDAETEAYESEYADFVKRQYLNIDPEMKEYLLEISKEYYFGQYGINMPDKVAEYVKGIADYSITYDPALDEEENVVLAFVEDYKVGNCKHFATFGTLLFRALGIPARYVIGYLTHTESGIWVQVESADAHAWVEIYVDGFGWKTVEVTPQRDNEITLKPVKSHKVYDGTPLYPEQTLEGFEEFAEKGYTYEAVISGEITEPGKAESMIESVKIYDQYKRDVTRKFKMTFEPGEMIVKIGVIALVSEDWDYVYDGTVPMSNLELCSVILPENGLWEGHEISFKERELSTEIGNHPHAFSVVVTDKETGENVTWMYSYVNNFGTFRVNSNVITIRAGSAEKIYDGIELTCNEYEIIKGTLAYGDYIKDIYIEGSQTLKGSSTNEISEVVIYNKDGEDVTLKYQIFLESGTLRVLPSK